MAVIPCSSAQPHPAVSSDRSGLCVRSGFAERSPLLLRRRMMSPAKDTGTCSSLKSAAQWEQIRAWTTMEINPCTQRRRDRGVFKGILERSRCFAEGKPSWADQLLDLPQMCQRDGHIGLHAEPKRRPAVCACLPTSKRERDLTSENRRPPSNLDWIPVSQKRWAELSCLFQHWHSIRNY